VNDQEAEDRIAELEENLAECNRLRLCENQATARSIEAMREAKAETKRERATAKALHKLIVEINEALGLHADFSSVRILARIRELMRAGDKSDDSQGTA
jgi:hypothetical protein